MARNSNEDASISLMDIFFSKKLQKIKSQTITNEWMKRPSYTVLVMTIPNYLRPSLVVKIHHFENRQSFCEIIIIFWPRYSIPREWKNTLWNTKKYKNQVGMNLTPPPPSQNSHAVRWHCTAESERRVAEIKSWFLSRRPTDQQACDQV